MRGLLALVGVAILIVTASDVVRTVFDIGRAGPVTGRLTALLWRGVLGLRRRGASHRALQVLGIVILLSVVAGWLLAAAAGWTLVLNGSSAAVVDSVTGRPVGFWDRAYLAGGGLFTFSNGEFRGGAVGWRLALAATAANGLLLVTLSITYLLPVLEAASERRNLAAYISCLGETPQEILLATWDGSGLQELHDHLVNLLPLLTDLAQRHLAYPVLHFFHSADPRTGLAPRLAALDEALTIAEFAVDETVPLPRSVRAGRRALRDFIDILLMFPIAVTESPPAPRVDRLAARGVPLLSEERFAAALAGLEERRRNLLVVVREDGWDWDDVVRGDHAAAQHAA
ncbi:MAG: hypothetical protein M3N52_13270 [Actinomycetota bacterium]|nr:hypothetical protein [Actinomycetota bacterium]